MIDLSAPLTSLLTSYVNNPQFVLTCLVVFFIIEALQQIPQYDKLAAGYKQLSSLVLGLLFGTILIGPTTAGAIAGIVAGGVTTLLVDRISYWLGNVGTSVVTTAVTANALP